MPAVNFEISWPDGETTQYYSPSTVIKEYLKPGQTFNQLEFSQQIHLALNQASERVKQKFGYYCSAASAELDRIDLKLKKLEQSGVSGPVTVTQLK